MLIKPSPEYVSSRGRRHPPFSTYEELAARRPGAHTVTSRAPATSPRKRRIKAATTWLARDDSCRQAHKLVGITLMKSLPYWLRYASPFDAAILAWHKVRWSVQAAGQHRIFVQRLGCKLDNAGRAKHQFRGSVHVRGMETLAAVIIVNELATQRIVGDDATDLGRCENPPGAHRANHD